VLAHSLTREIAMAKLTLQIEQLKVESFETAGEGAAKGTVFGHESDQNATCVGHYTCDRPSCGPTCGVESSCELINSYCGTYVEVGCPASYWNCTVNESGSPCV
jgi:hypothetical protein